MPQTRLILADSITQKSRNIPDITRLFPNRFGAKSTGLGHIHIVSQPQSSVGEGLQALTDGRLVSVVGMPGIGKTEVGFEIARQREHTGDRVLLLEAQSVPNLEQLRTTVAVKVCRMLDHSQLPDNDDDLVALLARLGPTLLIIDNAEDQMLDDQSQTEFAVFLDGLLRVPELRILLTTRWPVELTRIAERPVRVEPMEFMQAEDLLRTTLKTKGIFEPAWETMPEWKQLVTLLDGHPLSVHLIAGQFGLIPDPRRLYQRLNTQRLSAVVDSTIVGRKAIDNRTDDRSKNRSRSLQTTMDLSYTVLKERYPNAATLLLGLAHIPTGLPYDSALSVAGGDGTELHRLIQQNLLDHRRGRCRFPVPLQWYAKEHPDQAHVDPNYYRRRTLEALVRFVTQCYAQMVGGDILSEVDKPDVVTVRLGRISGNGIRDAFDKLTPELPTLENLLTEPLEVDDSGRSWWATLASIAHQLLTYVHLIDLDRRLLTTGLQDSRRRGDRLGEANTRRGLGDLNLYTGDPSGALNDYEAALALYEKDNNDLGVANTLHCLGNLKFIGGEFRDAIVYSTRAITAFGELESQNGIAHALHVQGRAKIKLGEFSEAHDDLTEALGIYQTIGNRLGEANSLLSLAEIKLVGGNYLEAQNGFQTAYTIFAEVADRSGQANALKQLGDCRARTPDADYAKAADDYDNAMKLFVENNDSLGEALTFLAMGQLRLRLGNHADADCDLNNALDLFRKIGDWVREADAVLALALLKLAQGDPHNAFQMLAPLLRIFQKAEQWHLIEASWGYLAHCAHALANLDRAIVLAEESLIVGRRINDGQGQGIGLRLIADCFLGKKHNPIAYIASVMCLQTVAEQINDLSTVNQMNTTLATVRANVPAELFDVVHANPERALAYEIQKIRDRLNSAGINLLDPL